MKECYIGIDIGGTNLRCALVGSGGTVFARCRSASLIAEGREAFCMRLLQGIDEMRVAANAAGCLVSGVGVGAPGLIDRCGTIRSSANMRPLDGFNLAEYIQSATGLAATCLNDANLIAIGEHAYGAGRPYRTLVVLTLGTGLGSGLILDGRIWTGSRGFAAEFGHVTVEPEGFPCSCGNQGCLEQYVSAGAIVRMYRERMVCGIGGCPDDMDARHVATIAQQDDAAARQAFEQAGRMLGLALAGLANTLNIEAAVICGGVSASLELMMPSIRAEFSRRCFPEIAGGCSILGGELGDDAGLVGAARVAALGC
ncbi:MAG TPA: ROK family protein [Deltaproteobacteria bacterium]|nr:ROK family protein [Deltaproteobacteria bacterium]